MKIFVKAKPNSKKEKIQKIDEINYVIFVKEPPRQGKANRAIIRVLAEYFKKSPSQINIVSGHTSRLKVIEIL